MTPPAGRAAHSLWMIVASFMFTGMGICVKLATRAGYSPAEVVFYRSIVALTLMICVVRWTHVSVATPYWKHQIKRGVTGFVSLSTYFFAISLLPLATAVTLNYTSPIFLILLLICFRSFKPTAGVVLALGAGLSGAVCLLHPSFSPQTWWGAAVALTSAILAAMTYFDVRELGLKGEPEARTVFWFSAISTVLGTLWVLFAGFHALTLAGFLSLIGVGVFATLAQLAMTRAYGRGKALLTASLAYTTIVFATLFAAIFWQEHLGGIELIGIALIIGSGIVANWLRRK